MALKSIRPGVSYAGAQDWDRRLFDELIPLPDGTSYNSYIVKGGEKTALIDTVDPTKEAELLSNLNEAAAAGIKTIDYVIANHAEQDHSGSIPAVLKLHPEAKVVCTPKCKEFLIDLLGIGAEKFITVADGEELPLGGKTLKFIHTPWVHWPETMLTHLKEDRILFSCDLFGSHLAGSELFVKDECKVHESAKRYYAEIMMPFRKIIRGHLEKIRPLDFDIVAPSHGPIYDNPGVIREAYRGWTSDEVKDEVVLAYVSMHGSTKAMAGHLEEELESRGITVAMFNLAKTDIGELAMALVDAGTIVLGTPTVLAGPHPAALYAASLASALRPKARFAAVFGSYGWGGQAAEKITGALSGLGVEALEPVMAKGYPKKADLDKLDRLAAEIERRHGDIKAKK